MKLILTEVENQSEIHTMRTSNPASKRMNKSVIAVSSSSLSGLEDWQDTPRPTQLNSIKAVETELEVVSQVKKQKHSQTAPDTSGKPAAKCF